MNFKYIFFMHNFTLQFINSIWLNFLFPFLTKTPFILNFILEYTFSPNVLPLHLILLLKYSKTQLIQFFFFLIILYNLITIFFFFVSLFHLFVLYELIKCFITIVLFSLYYLKLKTQETLLLFFK